MRQKPSTCGQLGFKLLFDVPAVERGSGVLVILGLTRESGGRSFLAADGGVRRQDYFTGDDVDALRAEFISKKVAIRASVDQARSLSEPYGDGVRFRTRSAASFAEQRGRLARSEAPAEPPG
jgi:hypothetical protein